jgi:Sulfotransferase family
MTQPPAAMAGQSLQSRADGEGIPDADRSPSPIFVGGTGRSGTTVVGRLLGRHPDHEVVPVEAQFHCNLDGLPGVLSGAVTPEAFARRTIEQWYHPDRLAAFVERDALDAALAHFLERAPSDPIAAGRRLIQELFGDYARSKHKRGWVEMTPRNAISGAPALVRMFPELRLVHVMRDGRDVASSLVAHGLIGDVREALGWWESRMLQAHEACRSLPREALHIVCFERLLVEDRAGALKELNEFLGWSQEPAVQGFFVRRMKPVEAHVGRWETHFSPAERAFLVAEYPAVITRLKAAGVPFP